MAVGVPETEVFAAADRVLARGERPTVERVRVELGRGSPNRIGPLLEQWWEALTKRLAGETRLPELPPEVAGAFRQVWVAATEHAATSVEAGMATERDALRQQHEALAEERTRWQHELETARGRSEEAEQKYAAAELRIADLQRLLDQQVAQLGELQSRHAQTLVHGVELATKLEASQQTLLAARAEAASERTALETAHRASEDRWLREVDRARQEEARTATRLRQAEQSAETAGEKASQELVLALDKLRRTEKDLVARDAKIGTLEGTLDRLHGQLKERLHASSPSPTRKPKQRAEKAVVQAYPPDDGPLTAAQLREIRKLAGKLAGPGSKQSVRSSLLEDAKPKTTASKGVKQKARRARPQLPVRR